MESSEPGEVDRDTAMWLLQSRAVLTSAVCNELEYAVDVFDRRPLIALGLLRVWIRDELGFEHGGPSDGLSEMVVPEAGRMLMAEIAYGAKVCDCLGMLRTADNEDEVKSDAAELSTAMSQWRASRGARHPCRPVRPMSPRSPECPGSPRRLDRFSGRRPLTWRYSSTSGLLSSTTTPLIVSSHSHV